MPIKVMTRGKPSEQRVEAFKEWASGVSGASGVLLVRRTKVLWRPDRISSRLGLQKQTEKEGAATEPPIPS